ncbi:MAG: hypothetical protein CMB82_03730 [Flammeovirgaceae bacterium]|nr:hypothetical protein [Flammeovirgaceae bacterium]
MIFTAPLQAFAHWEKNPPNQLMFHQPFLQGSVRMTYQEAGIEIRKMAQALIAMDYVPKSKIALLSKNCSHWIMADLAIQMAGHISVPIYPTINADSIAQIMAHSDSKAVIIGKLDNYEAQKSGLEGYTKIGIKAHQIEEKLSWEDMVASSEALKELPEQKAEDLLTIMYTSGTTGSPKGVMHSVSSFNTVTNTAVKAINLKAKKLRFFSYLPLTHIAERIGIEMFGLYQGGSFNFPLSIETFADDLAATQPDLFFAVPRIWTKFQDNILNTIPQKKLDFLLKVPILNSIIRKKIKKKLGLLYTQAIFTGAAPISISQLIWFQRLGIDICQAYGLTEDCILSHFNLPGKNKFGSVGKPLGNVEIKFSPEDEILIKSECLMLGYYKEKQMTSEVFTEDGYLRTGDIGEYDHDGYLWITGRIKDQFKTDKGKYISPAPIELEMLKNSDIDQVCVVGTGIPQPIGLIVLSQTGKEKEQVILIESLEQTIEALNPTLESVAKIQKVVVMKEDWTIDNGLLTPTLKIKRNRVEKIHQDMYSKWFSEDASILFE